MKYEVRLEAREIAVGYITVNAENAKDALDKAQTQYHLATWSHHRFDKEFGILSEVICEKEE